MAHANDRKDVIGRFLAGLIVGALMLFGGPLAAGFLAKTLGAEFAILGVAVPIIIAITLMIGSHSE